MQRLPSNALAVFARAPVPGKVKTRLIPALGAREAAAFYVALVSDTLQKCAKLGNESALYLYIAGRSLSLPPARGRFLVRRQRGAGLGQRLEDAFRWLLRSHTAAVVIGTDSPLVPASVLRQALSELRVSDAVLGPCPDGGYYLVGLRRHTKGILRGVRWGSAWAFRDTLESLLGRGYLVSVLEPFPDVDRPRDLRRLKQELALNPAARRLAPATWRFLLDRSPGGPVHSRSLRAGRGRP